MVTDFKAGEARHDLAGAADGRPGASRPSGTSRSSSRAASRAPTSGSSTRPRRRSTTCGRGRRCRYATTGSTMNKAAFSGLATPSLGNSLISANSAAYNKKLKPYTFNLQKAKQLFDAAGVKPGTTFTFWALAGRRDEWITMAQILQQDLQKIGLNLSIQRKDVSTWLGEVLPGREELSEHDHRELLLDAAEPDVRHEAGAVRLVRVQLEEQHLRGPRCEGARRQGPGGSGRSCTTRCSRCSAPTRPVLVIAHQTNIVACRTRSRAPGRTRRATCTSRRRRASSARRSVAGRPDRRRPARRASRSCRIDGQVRRQANRHEHRAALPEHRSSSSS